MAGVIPIIHHGIRPIITDITIHGIIARIMGITIRGITGRITEVAGVVTPITTIPFITRTGQGYPAL